MNEFNDVYYLGACDSEQVTKRESGAKCFHMAVNNDYVLKFPVSTTE